MQAIDRAVAILKSLTPTMEQRGFTLTEVARAANLSPATTRRILAALVKHDLAEYNPATRRYQLGVRLLQMGLSIWQTSELRDVARASMVTLARETGETAYLCIRDGHVGVFIEKVEHFAPVRVLDPLGLPIPLHRGASKRVLLAYQPPLIQDELIQHLVATYDDANEERIRRECAEIRARGYACSFGTTIVGTAGIAAPIFDTSGEILAAVGIAGPENHFGADRIESLIQAVCSMADEINRRTGGGSPDNVAAP